MEKYKSQFPKLSSELLKEIYQFCVYRYRPDSDEFVQRFRAICTWETEKLS